MHSNSAGLQTGDMVSVFADMEGKCRRGLATDYEAQTLYVGNGVAELSRTQLFGSESKNRSVPPLGMLLPLLILAAARACMYYLTSRIIWCNI